MPLVKGPRRGSVQVPLPGLTAESILTARLQSKRTRLASWSKGLEAIIPASVVHWRMLEDGWTFEDGLGVVPDPNLGAKFLYKIYIASDPTPFSLTYSALWPSVSVIPFDKSSEGPHFTPHSVPGLVPIKCREPSEFCE
jgi:hypothetical protein